MASQDKTINEKIVQEVSNQLKMKDSQMMSSDHQNHSPGSHRQKRPYRLVPINAIPNDNNKIDHGKIFTNFLPNQQQRFYGPPTNCSDLARLGHTLNGFYTVSATSGLVDLSYIKFISKLETVYCSFKQPEDFNSSAVEKRIPYLNLNNFSKSSGGIHFNVQGIASNVKFGQSMINNNTIRFQKVLLNMGDSFDVKKGIFMAPKSGVYQFIFTLRIINEIPLKSISSPIYLILNKEGFLSKSHLMKEGSSMIEVTTKLKQADLVYIKVPLGDGLENNWASFSGSLLEEL